VLAGLLYGMRPWPRALRHRVRRCVAAFGLAVAGMAAAPDLVWLAVAMVVAGATITPQATAHSMASS